MSTRNTKNSKTTKSRAGASKSTTKKAATSSRKQSQKSTVAVKSEVKKEIIAIICIAIGIFCFIAIYFESAGSVGDVISDVTKGLFSHIAYVLPWLLVIIGALNFLNKEVVITWQSYVLLFVIIAMMSNLNGERFVDESDLNITTANIKEYYSTGMLLESGGAIGMIIATFLMKYISVAGIYTVGIAAIIVCTIYILNSTLYSGLLHTKNKIENKRQEYAHRKESAAQISNSTPRGTESKVSIVDPFSNNMEKPKNSAAKSKGINSGLDVDFSNNDVPEPVTEKKNNDLKFYGLGSSPKEQNQKEITEENQVTKSFGLGGKTAKAQKKDDKKGTNQAIAKEMLDIEEYVDSASDNSDYKLPSIELLKKGTGDNKTASESELREKARKLEETLHSFKVDANVVAVTQGPAVTRYEIQPNIGVRVNSIVRLGDDIALSLEAKNIRIEAPIPGKAAVGIEVENGKINMVTLREIISSKEFKSSKSKITFAIGKDISGKPVIADLKTMPHMLIAGATGSGKSVCINSIITSLLYKATPDQVKLVLIDPKVVELGSYNGIPHLLIPVVTEPAKAAAALNWAVGEMNDRYKKFAEAGVRDLESYNEAIKQNHETKNNALPQIVIIIDELADLMMAAPSQVEESICRLAQMARAAGMHLIVATQRPSVDIITGVIKANIPSRIAFAVSSQFDSRTILDMNGAEKLAGKGDMLFSPVGLGKPVRVQGAFISDSEVNQIISHAKSQVTVTKYATDVLDSLEKLSTPIQNDDTDDLLPEAIESIIHSNQASISMLQRRFRIGYNRAARIIDMIEARGIIGPSEGSKPRQILMSLDEYEMMMKDMEEM